MFYIVVQILVKICLPFCLSSNSLYFSAMVYILLLQFSKDIDVYMTKPDGTYKMMKITRLLQ